MSIIKQIQARRRQLNELSKETLGNYAYKAAHKMAAARADHALAVDNKHRAKAAGKETAAKYAGQNISRAHKEHEKRAAGFFKAVSKLAKEEIEQVDEVSKETLASYVHKANDQLDRAFDGKLTPAEAAKNKASKKKIGDKRIPGLELAVKKYHAKKEVEQIDELSKDALKNYGRKALKDVQHREKDHDTKKFGSDDHIKSGAKIDTRNHYIRKAADKITNGASRSKLSNHYMKSEVGGGHKNYALTVKRAKERMQREEIEQIDEAQMGEVAKKLAHHGYKKFGDSDRLDHKSTLTHFHHEEHGHLVCVDHNDHGRVNSASALKCTNSKTGEMHHSWGQEHPHVEHALSELGHKSYVGLKEDEQIDELSKTTLGKYVKRAAGSIDDNARDGTAAHFRAASAERNGDEARANKLDDQKKINDRKGANRQYGIKRAIDRLTKEEVEQVDEISQDLTRSYLGKAIKDKHKNALHYDRRGDAEVEDEARLKKRDSGINLAAKKLHMKEPHGVAKVAATKSKIREELESIFEEGNVLHKKGRPKKARHEDGKIVNDPDA